MDLKVIADALATTIGTVTAYGETATATARLPNQVGKLALLVYPPEGELEIGLGRQRNDHYVFMVRVLRDPLDVPGRSDALYAWANAIRDLAETDMDLGLEYVKKVTTFGLRMAIDGQLYSGLSGGKEDFDVVEFGVRLLVKETVATVSM